MKYLLIMDGVSNGGDKKVGIASIKRDLKLNFKDKFGMKIKMESDVYDVNRSSFYGYTEKEKGFDVQIELPGPLTEEQFKQAINFACPEWSDGNVNWYYSENDTTKFKS